MNRLYISAAHKSSGKTIVTLGLCRALAERGQRVAPFKKGPDYIDPLWLSAAAGRICYNLDFNTQSPAEIRKTFLRGMDADIALVEGNKGLHDGVSTDGSDSNAALARHLRCPVVLVIDTLGTTRGIAPLLRGYQMFDRKVQIAGVILNKVANARHERKLRAALETYTDIPVLGAIGRHDDALILERHLGLIPLVESGGAEAQIAAIAKVIADTVDLGAILDTARAASPLPPHPPSPPPSAPVADVTVAVARDSAFCFYYPDDLEALRAAGAEIAFFSTLQDGCLPPADGLFIGGGFPETHLDALANNGGLLADLRESLAQGLPTYAECGGLMYLCRSITHLGYARDMVGAIPADVIQGPVPRGRGQTVVQETDHHPWPGGPGPTVDIRAHEFHYSNLENLDPGLKYAFTVKRGTGIDGLKDGLVINNILAGYTHFRETDRYGWATRFVDFLRARKTEA
ncbi:MAG: cobyrinate a,c-diamide synthase [Magnetospiraceae bacterium]